MKTNRTFYFKYRNFYVPIAIIFALVSQSSFSMDTVTISNGKVSYSGTGVWSGENVKDSNFSWGDGKATYIGAHSFSTDGLTVNVTGQNPNKRYVLLGDFNFNSSSTDQKGELDVNLASNSTFTASMFGLRNDLKSSKKAELNLKGESGVVLQTSAIIGADSGRSSSNPAFLKANSSVVSIVGPFTIEGTGDKVLIAGGHADSTSFNKLTIDGTTLNLKNTSSSSKITGGAARGSDGDSFASYNEVVIKNSPKINVETVAGAVADGTAEHNYLTIQDSKVEADKIAGGKSSSKVSESNVVNISGSDITGKIFGGYSEEGAVHANAVNLFSGTFKGEVYGGFSEKGSAESNLVNLAGKGNDLNLSEASLIGGNGKGNTLEVSGWSGNVKDVNSFENFRFKNVDWVPSGAVINVTGDLQNIDNSKVFLQNQNDGDKSVFDINFAEGSEQGYMFLIKPNKITPSQDYQIIQRGWVQDSTLTQKRAGVLRAANSAFVVIEPDAEVKPDEPEHPGEGTNPEEPENPGGGVSPDNPDKPGTGETEELPYPPEVSGPDNLPPSVEDVFPGGPQPAKPNNQVTIINDSREASISFVNQGTDHVLSVLDSFDPEERQGIRTFASVYGQVSKYKGNDSIRMKATSMVAGVGDQKFFGQDKFEWGVFAEAGIGNYNTANSFRGHDLKGNGHANYAGGGLTMRYLMQNGLYGETAFRAGYLHNKLDNGILHKDGTSVSYKVNSYYLSTIVGAGYRFNFGGNDTVAFGTRYLYGRYGSDTVDIGDNDYRFEAVNSHRVQLLTSITHKFPNSALVKAAVIGEREFDGKTRNSVDGMKSPGKGFGGNTLIGDLSALIKPAKDVSVETRFRGFVGKRQGVSAKIQLNYYW